MTKDEAAVALAERHRNIDTETLEIVRFLSDDEDDEREPIKLMEVSPATISTGQIDAFTFAATADFPYRTSLAVISPEEWALARQGELPLPNGWTWDRLVPLYRAKNLTHG